MTKLIILSCLFVSSLIGFHHDSFAFPNFNTKLKDRNIYYKNMYPKMILDSIIWPLNHDNLDQPALSCDGRIDKNLNIDSYFLNSPQCVGGFILDSAFWLANSGEPDEYPKRRLPKILGWNYISDTSDINYGHPSPDNQFYPEHNTWAPNDPLCWGPNQHIMGIGTGRPLSSDCQNLNISYSDEILRVSLLNCDAGPVGCYKLIRTWTVHDSCSMEVHEHSQIIKVSDKIGPLVLYPDTVNVRMEVWTCTGRWDVQPPWIVDNCSNELHYSVEIDSGTILGNEVSGFVVVNIKVGFRIAYIIASDCCGNVTKKIVILRVEDNVPPVAICESQIVVSISGNMSPGQNFAKIFAESIGIGSFDNCSPVFFKAIRIDQLKGTNKGSSADQADTGNNCAGINGDDDLNINGNQIYFDDYVTFCCSDVGNEIPVVLRVYDRDPGIGPVIPSKMDKGSDLFNRYSDCTIRVTVQDKSIPTLVAPPNIVVSCKFDINMDQLTHPTDQTFGKIVTDLTQRSKVSTRDIVCYNYCVKNDKTGYPGSVTGAPPSNPPAPNRACEYYRTLFDTAHFDQIYELVWGFDGYVLSACENTPTIRVADERICGQGRIIRKITTNGPNGITVSASQTIWVVDCDPFYINRANDCDPLDDIQWPGHCNGEATIITDCGTDISPENPILGKPEIVSGKIDLCRSISIDYFDEKNIDDPDTCIKIKRTWIVIDHCNYDPSVDSLTGKWTYTQNIKIRNAVNTDQYLIKKAELLAIPNPSSGNCIIKSNIKIDHIKCLSSIGKIVLNFPVPEKYSINLENLASGIYFVQVLFKGKEIGTIKLIILK